MALPSLYSSTCEEEAWRLEHRRANRTSFRHAIVSLGWAYLESNSSYNALTCFATLRERSPKIAMRGVRSLYRQGTNVTIFRLSNCSITPPPRSRRLAQSQSIHFLLGNANSSERSSSSGSCRATQPG